MIMEGDYFTCIGIASGKLIAGTTNGFLKIDLATHKPEADFTRKTTLAGINRNKGN